MTCTGKALLSTTFLFALVHSFSFDHNTPSQCDLFTVSWSGGTAPFSLLITPIFDNPRNFSIPNTASGSFNVQLPLNSGQQFIVSMSDATGFGSGGVSDVLTVGNSVSGASCDTRIPPVDFQFQLDSILQQCAPYSFSGYDGATQPVTITGLVPHGKSFQLHPPSGPSSFVWDAVNVPTGTSLIFFLTDGAGRFGGSSHINQVGSSTDITCINDQSPSSTAGSASSTIGAPAATSDSGNPSSTDGVPSATETATRPSRVGPGTIGGAVVGSLIAVMVVGTLLVFWFNQYRKRRAPQRFRSHTSPPINFSYSNSANPPNQTSPFGPPATPWTTFGPTTSGADYIAEPWMMHPTPHTGSAYSPSVNALENAWSARNEPAPPLRSMAKSPPPSQRPTRLVLHTDVDDEVELPPQYLESRTHPYSLYSNAHPPHP